MTRLQVSLRGVGCRKPRCSMESGILHRHHIRHQAMWLGIWASRRAGERKFQDFIERYYRFEKEDICYLCDRHHAEIHSIYDRIINADRQEVGRPLSKYSWVQAEKLMDKLEEEFNAWIKRKTKGISPKTLSARRRVKRIFKPDTNPQFFQ